jgi:predicted enzyme related to lactoylglutathione lyase
MAPIPNPAQAKPKGGFMKRVTGIGGIFFKAQNAPELRNWYKEHLGIEVLDWGGAVFPWRAAEGGEPTGCTVWSIFPATSDYFNPSNSPFMINYRVENLDDLLAELRKEGLEVEDKIVEEANGRFAWVRDPEGNRIELWQPAEGS